MEIYGPIVTVSTFVQCCAYSVNSPPARTPAVARPGWPSFRRKAASIWLKRKKGTNGDGRAISGPGRDGDSGKRASQERAARTAEPSVAAVKYSLNRLWFVFLSGFCFYDRRICMDLLNEDGKYYGLPLGLTYAGFTWADVRIYFASKAAITSSMGAPCPGFQFPVCYISRQGTIFLQSGCI